MNTVTTVTVVAKITTKLARMPYAEFAIGLEQLYTMPLGEDEDIHTRSLAIDRYIDSNGWSWDALIEESEKPDVNLN